MMDLYNGVECLTEEALVALGEIFGQSLKDGDVVALYGDLGVGKTTFTRGIVRALAIDERITSPTFTILMRYSGIMDLIHIDAYRLGEGEYLGIWDYLQRPSIIVVEWPQRLVELRGNITHPIFIEIGERGERWVRRLDNEV
ncbi:MAG: tRNA (adenosine(37)-N6)-threonylcarbamoyltransferase complex ATPase subunit type 1 TsaE [Puniceicoccales bacterium]|jgi:tRNA threonylcarbamoyladenosine biosynthesis protein TsaE|nr:tRNA (adenosine(37)-N6)-threonylcarbamoyltransferase complex ATPase subunit type 1 TsaE [Puniceicoccales bacterium]